MRNNFKTSIFIYLFSMQKRPIIRDLNMLISCFPDPWMAVKDSYKYHVPIVNFQQSYSKKFILYSDRINSICEDIQIFPLSNNKQ